MTPTVGRIVWFHPHGTNSPEPFAGVVVAVHKPDSVNITYFDDRGNHHSECFVLFCQENEPKPAHSYATWPKVVACGKGGCKVKGK